MHIKITKGLDLLIKGKPEGVVQELVFSGQTLENSHPKEIALNLWPFDNLRLKLLKKVGERVKIGEPLCEDKGCPGRMFVAPAAGIIKEVRRGHKRAIRDIIIEVDEKEEYLEHPPVDIATVTRHELTEKLMERGFFTTIRQRPFSILAMPYKPPRSIFVKAVESAPFVPPAELQVDGHEKDFQLGLSALQKLTNGFVHLVYREGSTCKAFTEAINVEKHTVEGPHPVSNASLHIERIDPIESAEDIVWTLNAHDVVSLGKLLSEGRYYTERVISIAGPGLVEGRSGYFRVREGYPIAALASGRVPRGMQRLISGDPLNGHKVEIGDFLGFYDYVFCVIPENTEREFMHFFKLGRKKYSFSRAYASGHSKKGDTEYEFTTNQHGEHRPFIDGSLYEKVMPLNISTIHLVKSVMAEDYELADELGFLSVDPEDFALPAFVCISKIEMPEIIRQGLLAHAQEMV